MIPVTKSFLPPIEEYMAQVQRAYNNSWLTNRGELVKELEHNLSDHLELKDTQILCLNNGTIPLQIALKLLGNGGEIITTPFSYVATSAAIAWEGCKPIFVDIHPEYLTIDESKIEAAITPKTTCILATHVFGNPCNVEEIDRIAKKHNLKVIYDGAHSFGVKYKGKSIFEYGDVSTCSFHATKLFHTGEGGAIFTKDTSLFDKLFLSHTFGHIADDYYQVGINGKMSELSAAMGLAVLPSIEDILLKRKNNFLTYQIHLNKHLKTTVLRPETDYNFSYTPIIFESEEILLKVKSSLESNNIFPRRYFYPSLNTISFYHSQNKMPVAESIASRVLCLPNFFELTNLEIENITQIILGNL
ncbi:MAG: DegT/DnrJ/EryC1/StrS family aminotransferase [Bacteroidia bacterium]|nr:DegT/DnrJ/EryC1/StrS family aminotransferase [Bacteroidia bacterium]